MPKFLAFLRELWRHNNHRKEQFVVFQGFQVSFFPLSLRDLVVGISSALSTIAFTIEFFSGGICSYTTEY